MNPGSETADALNARGNAQRASGDLQGAAASYRRSLEMRPDAPSALYNLGLTLEELGEGAEAERCFRRLCEVDPRDGDALIHLGALLRETGRLGEARAALERAVALSPDSPFGHFHLGLARKAGGDLPGAQAALETALRLDRNAEVLSALGLVLMEQERPAEALPLLQDAVRLQPDRAEFLNNLGSAFRLAGRPADAIPQFRAALELDPALVQAHLNLGDSHLERGDHVSAAAAFGEGLRAHPQYSSLIDRLLFAMQQTCDWSRFDELAARRRQAVRERPDEVTAPFTLLSISPSPSEQLACSAALARSLKSRVRDAPLPARPQRAPGKRLRIGYLSADLHEHVMAYILADLFELHDRSKFEVFAYSYGPDDRSKLRIRVFLAMEHFVEIRGLSDYEAAARIAADGIDVLVDLNAYTQRARSAITALRPAPVQVNFLGYPGTMGADFADYIVVDRFLFREGDEAHFAEKPVFMPGCYAPNDRHRAASDMPSRAALGLPEQGLVFCSFNQVFKILPDVFAQWMRILRETPGSVLWLLEANDAATRNLRREAGRAGVDPARLVFAPRVAPHAYLARLPHADLFMDTFPYNAHTTAADALWAGVPVLTRAGDTFASRVAGSMVSAAGLPELVTSTPAEYEALALQLARDPQRLSALRAKLAPARSAAALFDMPRFARALEAAYDCMVEIHRSGGAPRAIDAGPGR